MVQRTFPLHFQLLLSIAYYWPLHCSCFPPISSWYCYGYLQRFSTTKPWFACKYYSFNAATLTVLAVATKLPVDLSNTMPSRQDQLTKLTGSIMMCISLHALIGGHDNNRTPLQPDSDKYHGDHISCEHLHSNWNRSDIYI